jgi:RecQ helicase-like protein
MRGVVPGAGCGARPGCRARPCPGSFRHAGWLPPPGWRDPGDDQAGFPASHRPGPGAAVPRPGHRTVRNAGPRAYTRGMSRAVTIVRELSRDGRSRTLDLLSLDVTGDAHSLAALAASEEETQREDEVARTRLAMMRRYTEHTGCRRSFLLSYFGRTTAVRTGTATTTSRPPRPGGPRSRSRWARGCRASAGAPARSSGTTATRSRCCWTSTATASCSCRWCSSAACCGLREAQASRSR